MASAAIPKAREIWVVDRSSWESALKKENVDPEYAKKVLEFHRLATLVFKNPENPTPSTKSVPQSPIEPELLAEEGPISFYYARNPRVSNHIWVVLNRPVDDLSEVTADEAVALRIGVNRIQKILKEQLSIPNAVILQRSHSIPLPGRYVVEIIPTHPDSPHVLDLHDKVECNNYVYRHSLSNQLPGPSREERAKEVAFWKELLAKTKSEPLVDLPPRPIQDWEQRQTRIDTGKLAVLNWIHETLAAQGVPVERIADPSVKFPVASLTEKKGCSFCRSDVIDSQKVLETEHSYLLVNYKSSMPGLQFLIIPKRHAPLSNELSEAETRDMHNLAQRLCRVLEEKTGSKNITMYQQDGPAVGQTTPHAHLHLRPKTASLLRFLFFSVNFDQERTMTKEEMRVVCEEFGKLLAQD
ncbi:MAG: HIT domain-containing protein [Verrucomicrobia bacterium]|nr:HIT domain-containing protein [Verrucomicrobiota bacterium]